MKQNFLRIHTASLIILLVYGLGVQVAVAKSAVSITEIADAWDRRAAEFAEGTYFWNTADEKFGRFESYWIPSHGDVDAKISGRFDFSAQAAQYRSQSSEYPSFGYNPGDRGSFQAALKSKFPDRSGQDRRELLPYLITVTPEGCTHAWDGGVTAYPRAIVLPLHSLRTTSPLAMAVHAHAASGELFLDTPTPVIHQLLTLPLIIAFRPLLFDSRLGGAITESDVEIDNSSDGPAHLIMRLPNDTEEQDAFDWDLLLDAKRGYLVRRAVGSLRGRAVAQCDISYDQFGESWIPQAWTVQMFGEHPHLIQQVATASRASFVLHKQPVSKIKLQEPIPRRAWVEDRRDERRFIALDDREFEISDLHATWRSYPQVLAVALGEQPVLRSEKSRPWLRKRIVEATRWPGLLVPLTILGILSFFAIRLLASHKTAKQ